MPASALPAGGSPYPPAEFDPLGLEPITEVDLGLKIPNSQPQGWGSPVPNRKHMGMWVCGL